MQIIATNCNSELQLIAHNADSISGYNISSLSNKLLAKENEDGFLWTILNSLVVIVFGLKI